MSEISPGLIFDMASSRPGKCGADFFLNVAFWSVEYQTYTIILRYASGFGASGLQSAWIRQLIAHAPNSVRAGWWWQRWSIRSKKRPVLASSIQNAKAAT
jgi:hypothetical protein